MRVRQVAKALITLTTLAAFVGIHKAVHWLLSFALVGFPLTLKILEAATAAAFLTIGVILLVEMVQVFAPWAKIVATTPTAKVLAADEEE